MEKKTLFISIIILSLISIFNLLDYNSLYIKQIIWFFIGFILILCLKKYNIQYTYILYIIFNVLLLYLLLFGKSINGSKAWIIFLGLSFQPSEFMKVILIVLLNYIAISNNKYLLKVFIITLIPTILTFLEPDTGNVIFYLLILFVVVLLKEKNIKKILIPLSALVFCMIFLFISFYYYKDIFLKVFGNSFYYRMDRIINLFNDESYQLNQSLINISMSSYFGNNLDIYIPEAQTDFAFSLLIKNIGFIGIIIYFIINYIFYSSLCKMLKKSSGLLKNIIITFIIFLLTQQFIHIFMGIGLFPITGITLPFISYGGSSILSLLFIIGIISNYNNLNKNSMEYMALDNS